MKENLLLLVHICVYVPYSWQCVGLIYVLMASSRWSSYGGLNAPFDNVWGCIMCHQCPPTDCTVVPVTALGLIACIEWPGFLRQ